VGADQAQKLLDGKAVLLFSLAEVIQQDYEEARPLFGVQLATETVENAVWLPLF